MGTSAKSVHDPEKCDGEEFAWRLATNEDGWHCASCGGLIPGEPNGFRPDLDRKETAVKAYMVCMVLHEADLLYFSNSDHGNSCVDWVAKRCHELGMFDQYTMIRLFVESLGTHADYWQKIGEGVMSGNDKRARCGCGKLATINNTHCSWECMKTRERAK